MDLYSLVAPLQSWIFETILMPAIYSFGLSSYSEDIFDATGTALLGLLFVLVAYVLIRPLEAWRPLENWQDRKAIRIDVLYTLLQKSGALPLLFFLLLSPAWLPLQSWLHAKNLIAWQLEDLSPWLQNSNLAAFLVYALVFDFFEYWRHRLQHRLRWWWGLHSIHHSQQQMSFWCDSRNHVLDSMLRTVWLSCIALVIGIPGQHFLSLIILIQMRRAVSDLGYPVRHRAL